MRKQQVAELVEHDEIHARQVICNPPLTSGARFGLKPVHHIDDVVARDLKRHGNVAARVRKAVKEYAETGAHANNVTQLVGSTAWRMRVGDFRVIFENGEIEIVITEIAPRGEAYE